MPWPLRTLQGTTNTTWHIRSSEFCFWCTESVALLQHHLGVVVVFLLVHVLPSWIHRSCQRRSGSLLGVWREICTHAIVLHQLITKHLYLGPCISVVRCPNENHLEERLLDRAQVWASGTNLFLGSSAYHSPRHDTGCLTFCKIIMLPKKTIPQWTFLFWRLYPLKLDITFLRGGRGGSKVFAQRAPSSGEAYRCQTTAG